MAQTVPTISPIDGRVYAERPLADAAAIDATLVAARRALLGRAVETGTWFMNRCDSLDPALAWVGVKDSGRGGTLSCLGYEHLTRPKSFHLRTKTSA